MAKRRKVIRARDGRTFLKGSSSCYGCGDKVKYCLEQTLALTLVASDALLCHLCQWEDHGVPMEQEHFINYERVG